MNIKAAGLLDNDQVNSSLFLSHSGEPIDRYSEYLSRDSRSSGKSRNPRNLFDDSNRVDRKWLKIARARLNKWK